MKEDIRNPWIELGYRQFAQNGPESLKVERLSKAIGKNKSSFYHLFGDLDTFLNVLLKHHLLCAKEISRKEMQCRSEEELIEILIEHETDLLFNRQLRVQRDYKNFEEFILKTNQLSENALSGIWPKVLGLEGEPFLAELVYNLAIENFLLRITDGSINKEWLSKYFSELNQLVSAFKRKREKS